jgi:hypothetical protein
MSGKQLLKNKNVLRFFAHTLRALRLSWLGKRQQATCLPVDRLEGLAPTDSVGEAVGDV